MSVAQELEKVILKAAIDGTFSEDAVEQYRTVLSENSSLKAQVSADSRAIKETKKELETLIARSEVMRQELEAYKAREQELKDRENQAEVLEMSLKYEQKRVDDHKSMVQLVFRNSVLKSNVVLPGRNGYVDQYGTTQYGEASMTQPVETEET